MASKTKTNRTVQAEKKLRQSLNIGNWEEFLKTRYENLRHNLLYYRTSKQWHEDVHDVADSSESYYQGRLDEINSQLMEIEKLRDEARKCLSK